MKFLLFTAALTCANLANAYELNCPDMNAAFDTSSDFGSDLNQIRRAYYLGYIEGFTIGVGNKSSNEVFIRTAIICKRAPESKFIAAVRGAHMTLD